MRLNKTISVEALGATSFGATSFGATSFFVPFVVITESPPPAPPRFPLNACWLKLFLFCLPIFYYRGENTEPLCG